MGSFFNDLQYNFFTLIEPLSEFTLDIAVWSVFIGIVLAIVASAYNKLVVGSFVRTLLTREAFSEDKALTLGEAGFGRNIFIKLSLRRRGTLRNIVSSAPSTSDGAVGNAAVKKIAERFFIPDEHRLRASTQYRYDGKKLWVTLIIYALCILLFYITALLAVKFLPNLVELFNSVSELLRESARSSVSIS